MPPTLLASDVRGQSPGVGPARVYQLDGGLFLTQIGPDILTGGYDLSQVGTEKAYGGVVRFRGQLFVVSMSAVSTAAVRVFDEGGTNTWIIGPTAKGARGHTMSTGVVGGFGKWEIVQTPTQEYLCLWYNTGGTVPRCLRYDPDNGVNGTWTEHVSSGGVTGSPDTFVHNGIVYATFQNGTSASNNHSFDPVSGLAAQLVANQVANREATTYFTLYDRLFRFAHRISNGSGFFEEFSLGAWDLPPGSPTHVLTGGNGDCTQVAFPISPTKVLIIGPSSTPGLPNAGLSAMLVTTVGDSPTAGLAVSDVTTPVIPSGLRPPTGVGVPESYRLFGIVDTTTTPGTPTFWLYFHPDGVGIATLGTLFQVTDELTELVDFGPTASDSDFSYPAQNFYGGGHIQDGIDGSTRLVSVSPRGYASDTTGLRVSCSAHGDPVVLAYHNKLGAAFSAGQTISGGTSLATATIVGDGAAEGLYLRDVVGTFQEDETITASGGGTADLNAVLAHGAVAGGPFQVGEVVSSSGTGVGTVTHLGLGGSGEQLVKVEVTAGVFLDTEVITGGTSGATATLTAAPAGQHGGLANKKIRARYFLGAGPSGKGVPVTGPCTMVLGSGFKGLVSKGSGPGGEDELINVVADGSVGGDTPASFEWEFLADGIPKFLAENVILEIDRI